MAESKSEAPEPAAPAPVYGPRWAVIGIFLIMLVASFGYARAFLMPCVLAFLLALVFSPVRRAMERLGLPSAVAALVISGVLLAVVVILVLALAGPAGDWIGDARTIGGQIEWKLRDLRGVVEDLRGAMAQVDQVAESARDVEVQRVVIEGPGVASSLAGSVPGVAAQVVFTLALLFFLLASGDMFYEKIVGALPTFGDKRRAVMIAKDIERKLSHYLFTITAINAGLGVVTGLFLWAYGMPNPLLFGVMAGLVNFVPYVGSLVGVGLIAVVGLVSLPTAADAFVVAGVCFALTALEGQFVTPWLVGRNLRLNTVVVFLSVTFWAWVWSVVGMLVATPLLVAIRVFCEHIPSLERVGVFLSARGDEKAVDPVVPAVAPEE